MLKVADRVDADRVGNLPGSLRQSFDRRQRFRRESVAVGRLEHEEEVVVLRVGGLQVLEGHELGVLGGEEDPVVVGELEFCGANADDKAGDGHDDNGGPAPANHTACPSDCQAVDSPE